MEIVDIKTEDGIAEVVLNRPDRKNALSEAMFDAIAAAGETLKTMPEIRVVVLSGAGGDFCSGLDMAFMGEMAGRLPELRETLLNPPAGEVANWFQKPSYVWQELKIPVVAAIEGVCLGGGLQIALGADIRVAHPDARLSIMEAKWGLIPDMGISQSLPKLMPADRAKLLMMEAKIISGATAVRDGLVTELSEAPLDRAREIARGLAATSPDAVQGIKRLVEEVWTLPAQEGLAIEARIQAPIIGAPNQIEAVVANMQKRAPVFK